MFDIIHDIKLYFNFKMAGPLFDRLQFVLFHQSYRLKGGAHLDLCTEAIALLFQRIHFSFLSCHGDGCSGMLLTGNETLKREKEKEKKRERTQSVRCWSLGTARMNNSSSELFTRWEHLSSHNSSIIQSINKSEQTSPAGISLPRCLHTAAVGILLLPALSTVQEHTGPVTRLLVTQWPWYADLDQLGLLLHHQVYSED